MKVTHIVFIVLISLVIFSCYTMNPFYKSDGSGYSRALYVPEEGFLPPVIDPPYESYAEIGEVSFQKTSDIDYQIVSLDANTAAYTNMRRQIVQNQGVKADSIRIEEMINYFNYDTYDFPTGDNILAINSKIMDCPWNSEHKLLSVGIRTKEIDMSTIQNNLVFLIDVSGSMDFYDKLDLVKEAFSLLTNNLKENDTISIVVYAGEDAVIMDGVKGSDRATIIDKIFSLTADGTTHGAAGINTAYKIAEKHFVKGGNNRIILATDGDFNVGVSKPAQLKELIATKRDKGIYLTVLGFGYGNLKDNTLETLAKNGNGNYAYINSKKDAEKVFIQEAGGTLVTVAKDVKAKVQFNTSTVEKFRLIGYENKQLTMEEFLDTKTDAGDIGSGLTSTVVFEIKMYDGAPLDIGTYTINYKDPADNSDKTAEYAIQLDSYIPDEDIQFISAVVEFGLILRFSEYKGSASFAQVIDRLNTLACIKSDEEKGIFLGIVKKYASVN